MGFIFFTRSHATMQHNKFLVMDTGGFIRGFEHLDQFYSEYEMSTVAEVIDEIRDNKTRRKLESGVFEVHLRNPSPEAMKRTVDFCKATGDYAALSAVDIKVMALAVSVEMEKNGTKFLKDTPNQPNLQQARPFTAADEKQGVPFPVFPTPSSGPSQTTSEDDQADEQEEIVVEEDDDSDDEGWITPDNFTSVLFQSDEPVVEDDRVFVACCTTDFAMQNVLLQMGIKLLSIDGLQIRNLRNWILRCFACR